MSRLHVDLDIRLQHMMLWMLLNIYHRGYRLLETMAVTTISFALLISKMSSRNAIYYIQKKHCNHIVTSMLQPQPRPGLA